MHIVPDTLGDGLTLQLGKHRGDVHHSSAHRCRRVKVLANRHKGNILSLKILDHPRKVTDITADTVQAVDHQGLDLAFFYALHHPLKRRTVHIAAGKALVLKDDGLLRIIRAKIDADVLPAQIHLIADALALPRVLGFS